VDVRMPGRDGFEFLRQARVSHPETDVILMTGSSTDNDSKLTRAITEGAFYFITKPFERSVLLALVDRCLSLRNLDRQRQSRLAELTRELALAHAFQRSLLPKQPLQASGLRIEAYLQPTDDLSGDFFDYGVCEGVPWCFVCDVSGHGAAAAMVTGIVKAALTTALAQPGGPTQVKSYLRKAGASLATEMFLTHFFAWFEDDVMHFVNAGHADAICFGADLEAEPIVLETTEPLVNPEFCDLDLPASSMEFPAGSRLLLLTDGIAEARNPDGVMFSRARAIAAARRAPERMGASVLESLTAYRAGRPQEDDYTLLCVAKG